jgi:predicted HicB family RNase H-like nuclease
MGGDIMAYTKATNKAVQRYCSRNYDLISLRVPKGRKGIISAHAADKGVSLNGYIVDLIDKEMGREH